MPLLQPWPGPDPRLLPPATGSRGSGGGPQRQILESGLDLVGQAALRGGGAGGGEQRWGEGRQGWGSGRLVQAQQQHRSPRGASAGGLPWGGVGEWAEGEGIVNSGLLPFVP